MGACVSPLYANVYEHEAPVHPTQNHECVGDEDHEYDHAHVQVIHDDVHAHDAQSDGARRRQPSEKPIARITNLLARLVVPPIWRLQ